MSIIELNKDVIEYILSFLSFNNILRFRTTSVYFSDTIKNKTCIPYENNINHLYDFKYPMIFNLFVSNSWNLYRLNKVQSLTLLFYENYQEDIEYLLFQNLKMIRAPSFSFESSHLIKLILKDIKNVRSLVLPKLKYLYIKRCTFDFDDFALNDIQSILVKHSKTTSESFDLMKKVNNFWSINTIYDVSLLDEYKKGTIENIKIL